jgi:hypothetical protein
MERITHRPLAVSTTSSDFSARVACDWLWRKEYDAGESGVEGGRRMMLGEPDERLPALAVFDNLC